MIAVQPQCFSIPSIAEVQKRHEDHETLATGMSNFRSMCTCEGCKIEIRTSAFVQRCATIFHSWTSTSALDAPGNLLQLWGGPTARSWSDTRLNLGYHSLWQFSVRCGLREHVAVFGWALCRRCKSRFGVRRKYMNKNVCAHSVRIRIWP